MTASLDALHAAVARMGAGGLRRAADEAHRLAEDGYEALGHTSFDPLPVVITPTEWRHLRTGLRQRARLFDAILSDLYGPRTLLQPGAIAGMEKVTRDPRYLRTLAGLSALHVARPLALTTRLVRLSDHSWAVVEDAADVPIGVGSALSLRRVLSRATPELYRTAPVRRLLPYTDALRAAVHSAAAHPSGRPGQTADVHRSRTVVLVEGDHLTAPADEREAAEHRVLASLLGAQVVTVDDLRVDYDGVRTLHLDPVGSTPSESHDDEADSDPTLVDHIIRLVPARHLDPLDLGTSPRGGIPGLVEAVRNDLVRVTNPLGAGIAASPALRDILPDLCRALLHEDLILPSAQPDDDLFAWPSLVAGPLKRATGASISPRPAIIQMVTASTLRGYEVMPGGVGLVWDTPTLGAAGPCASAEDTSLWRSGKTGPRTLKDVWVLGADMQTTTISMPALSIATGQEGEPPHATTPAEHTPGFIPPFQHSLTASAAGDLLWLGRHLESVDFSARLLRVLADLSVDLEGDAHITSTMVAEHLIHTLHEKPARVGVTADTHDTPCGPSTPSIHALLDEAIRRAVARTPQPGLLVTAVDELDRAARALRGLLSAHAWPALVRIREELAELDQAPLKHPTHLEQPMMRMVESALVVHAALTDTLPRGAGWYLYDTGRRLERIRRVTSLLHAAFAHSGPASSAGRRQLAWGIAAITETDDAYRRTYQRHMDPHLLLGMLLRDESLPRSAGYQLPHLAHSLAQLLPGGDGEKARRALSQLQVALASWEGTHGTDTYARLCLDAVDALYAELDSAVGSPRATTRMWSVDGA